MYTSSLRAFNEAPLDFAVRKLEGLVATVSGYIRNPKTPLCRLMCVPEGSVETSPFFREARNAVDVFNRYSPLPLSLLLLLSPVRDKELEARAHLSTFISPLFGITGPWSNMLPTLGRWQSWPSMGWPGISSLG